MNERSVAPAPRAPGKVAFQGPLPVRIQGGEDVPSGRKPRALYSELNQATDGTVAIAFEYLEALIEKKW